MRGGHAEKILFLIDRIALRGQALTAFKEHLAHEPRWPNMEGEKVFAKDRRIYIATYPTMLNLIRDESQHISPWFFDFFVIDESHRSIYNTYGEILDYFKTVILGLTATATDILDHNTFNLFHCEDGLPTFAYTYEEAVNNTPPFLSNFQWMKIQTKFQMEGIRKRTISLEDQNKLILEGKDIEEINFEGTQLEKQVINQGTNSLIGSLNQNKYKGKRETMLQHNPELKSKIDQLWNKFWSGGISNPLRSFRPLILYILRFIDNLKIFCYSLE